MTPDFLARGAPAAVLRALPGSRAVGGAVRDFLAGKPIHDVDVAVPLPPDEVSSLLRAAGLKVFETGLKHGTVTAVLDREPVEVTSLRRDVSTDGRHAEVEWIADWREDAARRDFTINAMSMGLDGEVHDYFFGRDDLAAGRLRFVGQPAERLAEDYLRALRFFRFWARYGRGEPDAAAMAAIREAVPGLTKLSVERVWMEIKRLLQAPDPRDALGLMAETGVLRAVLPEAGPPERLATEVAWGMDREEKIDPLLRFAVLLPVGVDTRDLASRLKLSTEEADRLAALHDQADVPGPEASEWPGWRLREFRARIRSRTNRATPAELLFVAAAEFPDRNYRPLLDAVEPGLGPAFPLQGKHVLQLGVEPGPQVGRLLAMTRDWWLAGGAGASVEQCLEKLRQVMADNTG